MILALQNRDYVGATTTDLITMQEAYSATLGTDRIMTLVLDDDLKVRACRCLLGVAVNF